LLLSFLPMKGWPKSAWTLQRFFSGTDKQCLRKSDACFDMPGGRGATEAFFIFLKAFSKEP
jgi:hypothetical protein